MGSADTEASHLLKQSGLGGPSDSPHVCFLQNTACNCPHSGKVSALCPAQEALVFLSLCVATSALFINRFRTARPVPCRWKTGRCVSWKPDEPRGKVQADSPLQLSLRKLTGLEPPYFSSIFR